MDQVLNCEDKFQITRSRFWRPALKPILLKVGREKDKEVP